VNAVGVTTDVLAIGDKVDTVRNSGPSQNDEIQYSEDGLQIPIGNGGITPDYRWTQTLEECTLLVQCPNRNSTTPLRGKDIKVTFQPKLLQVQILQKDKLHDTSDAAVTDSLSTPTTSNGTILLDGELSQQIVPSESTWTIESGVLQIILFKHTKTFWNSIFMNDTIKIDTSLVDSRRHIDTYDEVTQAHIRKIMFEQQQHQAKGLPTTLDDTIITSSDGLKPKVPSVLPKGVEYIDQEILDKKMKELGK
jgi:hypothetical protein